jgi:ArsR family transcriptional regulator, zinc-responsive transcriptional repressor
MSNMKQPEPLPFGVLDGVAGVLRVLGHPHRLRIIELLSARPMNVGELTDELSLAQNAVSQHLGFMKAHGIVAATRKGRSVYYRVVSPHARSLLACIRRNAPASESSPRGKR